MNNNLFNDELFFDDPEMRDLDRRIGETMNKPTLLENVQQTSAEAASRSHSFFNEVKHYWYIYIPLAISSIFTIMLGLYMGLAPKLVTNANGSQDINFNTDWGHVVTAAIYVIAFWFVTEIAMAISHYLFHRREDNNTPQLVSSAIGMILALIGIIGTGWSGGTIVANTLGFLDQYKEIPPSAQKWVVAVIPVYVAFYTACFIVYKSFSRKATRERISREQRDRLEEDNNARMEIVEMLGQKRARFSILKQYIQFVEQGRMSPEEMQMALKSGKSISEVEKMLNRDLTGGDGIGSTANLNAPAPLSQPPYASYRGDPLTQAESQKTVDPRALPCGHIKGVSWDGTIHSFVCYVCQAPVSEEIARSIAEAIDRVRPARRTPQAPQARSDNRPTPAAASRQPYSEPTYHPVGMDPQGSREEARTPWRGETESFTAAIDIYDREEIVIHQGQHYTATETEVNNFAGIFWEIRPEGSNEIIQILSSVNYFLVNPQAKANANRVPVSRTNGNGKTNFR